MLILNLSLRSTMTCLFSHPQRQTLMQEAPPPSRAAARVPADKGHANAGKDLRPLIEGPLRISLHKNSIAEPTPIKESLILNTSTHKQSKSTTTSVASSDDDRKHFDWPIEAIQAKSKDILWTER